MRAAKENLLEPVQNFQNIKTNTYFSGQAPWNRDGIGDDHVPFLKRSRSLHALSSFITTAV